MVVVVVAVDVEEVTPQTPARTASVPVPLCLVCASTQDDMTVEMLLVEDAVAFVFGNALSLDLLFL